ncbi:MAG: BrnT family toxin [Nitrososphaerales archaeon]
MRIEEIDGFDWDAGNSAKNWLKHGVAQVECEETFFNNPLLLATDASHSQGEERYFALGRTDAGRQLFIVFTHRGTKIRVISARDMSRRERAVYAKANAEV